MESDLPFGQDGAETPECGEDGAKFFELFQNRLFVLHALAGRESSSLKIQVVRMSESLEISEMTKKRLPKLKDPKLAEWCKAGGDKHLCGD